MAINEFTLMLHNKGWTVREALERWQIHRDTWLSMRQREKDRYKLLDMINGLPNKSGNDNTSIIIASESLK